MEAKDTVMSEEQVMDLYGIHPHQLVPGVQVDELKLAQAEISFKTGEKEGVRRAYQMMKDQHYITDFNLDSAVDFLEKKYGEPS